MTDQERREIRNTFRKLSPRQQRDLLAAVCSNMVENKALDDMVELVGDQLGYSDALACIADYPKE